MSIHKTLELINKIQAETHIKFGWNADNGKWRFFLGEYHSPEYNSPEEVIVASIKFFSEFFLQVKSLAESLDNETT